MKQLKIELLEILETFLIMKKKIITNQQEQITFGVAIIFNSRNNIYLSEKDDQKKKSEKKI